MKSEKTTVIVVGAGPSGLAVGCCLSRLSIPYVMLEREDCLASLWTKYSYDRLHLHLPNYACDLPNMPFPSHFPRYVPANLFVQYLHTYAHHFHIAPRFGRDVEAASFDSEAGRWAVRARVVGVGGDCVENFFGRFLVVASGATADPFVPEIQGLEGFGGVVIHSTAYKSAKGFEGKRVLVVGAGNSGMEIALDLADHAAITSIIVRSPIHILSKGMMSMAMALMNYLPIGFLDSLMDILGRIYYGDLTKYGITRPQDGPFKTKIKYGKYPIIDLGTCKKIKAGQIQVLPAEIERINKSEVMLKNGKSYQFDSIVLCTGFRGSTRLWLKDDDNRLNDDWIPNPSCPNNWKGKNNLYCAGLSGRGFYGAKSDAQNIANDINTLLSKNTTTT